MRALLGALAAAALAGCPSPAPPEPKAAPPATAAATESAESPSSAPADAGVEPDPDAAAAPAEPPAPKRQVALMDYQLTAEHVDCSATDEIRVIGYPAGVPDCDTQVVCAVTAPKPTALLATGGDTAPCERGADYAAGESGWRALPELTRRLRKLCPGACCGLIVRGCI